VLKDALDAVRLGIACCALVMAGIHGYEASTGGLQNERFAGQAVTKIEPSLQSPGQVRDPTQEAVARYTYWLTLFTAVLAASTIALWWTTKASVNTLGRAERAYVKLSHSPPGLTFEASGIFFVEIEVRNCGRTPAKVTDTLLKPISLPVNESLPPNPDYSRHRQFPSSSAFLVANDYFFFGEEGFTVGADAMSDLQNGVRKLYLIGYVDYVDAFGTKHRGGYARRYAPHQTGNNLILVPDSAYNYDRVRWPGEGHDWD
jgi:hypothetical protein